MVLYRYLTKKTIAPYIVLVGIWLFFFREFIFFGLVPFPGDLLIAEYMPWKSFSYLGYIPGTYPSKLQYFDVIRQLYPWRIYAMELVKDGIFPLWNLHNFSGHPLFANSQSAVLYPLNFLFFIFDNQTAWSMQVSLQTLLTSIFTYLYARRISFSIAGALLAAVSFSYSLFSSTFLEYNTIGHVIVWFPLALYSIEGLSKRRSVKDSFLLIVSIVCAAFAGHIQVFAFTMIFSLIYAFFRCPKKLCVIRILPPFICGIGIAAIQLVPTLELMSYAARVPQSYDAIVTSLLLPLDQLIVLLSPDFFGNPATRNFTLSDSYPSNAIYIGIVPLIFALYAFGTKNKPQPMAFYGYAAGILAIILTRNPLSELLYALPIPLLSSGSPNNALFLVGFSLSILAGWQMTVWIKKPLPVWRVTVVCIAILGVYFLLIPSEMIVTKNVLYTVGLLGLVGSLVFVRRYVSYSIVLMVLSFILIGDLFYFFNKFNPFVPRELVYPETSVIQYIQSRDSLARSWGYGSAHIESNFDVYYGIYSTDGYDPLYPKLYGELMNTSYDGELPTTFDGSSRSDALLAPGYGETNLQENAYRSAISRLLGVSFILSHHSDPTSEKTFPSDIYTVEYEQDGWTVFRDTRAMPRAFFSTETQVINRDDFPSVFFSQDFDPEQTALVYETPHESLSACTDPSGDIDIAMYEPHHIEIETTHSCTALLTLSDSMVPGWRAEIDGAETPIYTSFHALRSVVVPSGTHRITFSYTPTSFSIGTIITILSSMGTLGYILRLKRYEA